MTMADVGGFAQAPTAFPTSSLSSRPAGRRAGAYRVGAVCGFLLLAVGLVFGQTLGHEFTGFDDNAFVYENPHVTAGLTLPGLWWALTDGTFGEWCPLSTLSHMSDCQLYGLNPAGHYLTNVLLHATSSVLLFLVLLRMTGDFWPSAWVAAVFAIHPLHVESVAWVAERRDVLSGMFFMLVLGAYTLYAERPSLARYLAVTGLFALGLMAKPMLVTVPFLLLLLDYWPLNRFRHTAAASPAVGSDSSFGRWPVGWRLVAEKIPLVALAAVASGIVLSTHAATRSTNPVGGMSLATRLASALVSYATYLGQSFYPVDLAPFYPQTGSRLPMVSVAGSLVLLVAITAVALFWRRRRPYLPVGWFWYLGMLVPVIGLVQLVGIARADRYTYLSQIGLTIALAWGVWSAYPSRQSRQAAGWQRWLPAVVSGAAVLVLGAVAWRQASYWRTAETLWTHTLACTEQNALAHYNLAFSYSLQAKNREAINQLHEALAADSVNRQLIADCHDLLGDILTKQGKTEEALAQYEQAVRVCPRGPQCHARLAIALAAAGQSERAIGEWRETVRLVPNHLRARLGLAAALLSGGNASEAVTECRKIIARTPNVIEAMMILGVALSAEGKVEEAIPHLERAVELGPHNAQAHFQLGLALNDQGQSRSAIVQFNEAIRLRPDNVEMLWHTAWILATSPDSSIRDGARAVTLATQAVELSGGHEPQAVDALAAALAETEKFSAAVEAAERASAMARGNAALVDAIEQRTRLYRQGVPYRQPASSGSGKRDAGSG